MIAKKYGSSVRAIKEANNLRSNLIHEQATYRIPVSGGVRSVRSERVRIPARRPPPPRREPSPGPSLSSASKHEQPTAVALDLERKLSTR